MSQLALGGTELLSPAGEHAGRACQAKPPRARLQTPSLLQLESAGTVAGSGGPALARVALSPF